VLSRAQRLALIDTARATLAVLARETDPITWASVDGVSLHELEDGLSPELVEEKVRLLDASFPSQAGRDWWDHEVFRGLLRLRGVECRTTYAEGFHARKVLVDLSEDTRGGDDDATAGGR
jgi:hypothetical protein